MNEIDLAKIIGDLSHPVYAAGIGACVWRLWQLERRIDAVALHLGVPRPAKRKSAAFRNLLLALTLGVACLVAGCVQTRVKTVDGTEFSSTRFLWPGKIQLASIEGTNGTKMRLEGYQSDAAQLAEGVAEGVTKGLGKAANPLP